MVQQRGADYDAGVSRSDELEHDADRAAAGLITEKEMPVPRGKSGLRLQLDDCCEDPESLDWHNRDALGYTIAAVEMKQLREEQQRLLAQPGMDPARAARLAEIDREMQAIAGGIQSMGVQRTTSEIITGVLANQDLRTVSVTEFRGTDPARLYWGEQREFEVKLGYVPRDTEVMIFWGYTAGRDEYALDRKDYRAGGGIYRLEGEFWTHFGELGAADNEASGHASSPGFTLMAAVIVGGQTPPETESVSPWLDVEQRVPSNVTIMVPSIDQRPPTPPAGTSTRPTGTAPASTTPATGGGGTPTPPPGESADADMARQLEALISGPTSPTASGQDVILEGARIHYRLSWLAPMLYGQNPRYGIMWRIDRMADSGTRSRVETFGPGPLWGITGPLHGPGRYEIRADVVTRQPFERLGGFGSTSVVSATRTLQVMSATDIGERALQTYVSSGGPPNYAAFVADLDQQIADLQTTLATGSVTPGAISSQIDQLRDIRGRLLTEMGSTGASPFPSDGNFVQGTTYAAPLSAVMVHPSHAGAVPMSIYLRVWHASGNWQCRLVDATTSDVIAVPGSGGSVEEAIRAAIEALKSRNEYPQEGYLYYSLRSGGMNISDKLSTSRWDKTFTEWFDKILFVVGTIVGVVLLLTPEPTGITKAAGLALLGVSVLRSAYAIYSNLRLGRPVLDQRNVLEALSILSAFLGVRGSQLAQRAASIEATSFRVGRGMIIASFATDTGSFVWAANDALQQLEAAAYAGGDQAQHDANFNSTVMRLAVQGLLLVGNAHDVFRPVRGARRSIADALATGGEIRLDPASRSRIDTELRRMGFNDDTSRMTDAELVRQFAETHMANRQLQQAATQSAAPPPVGGTAGRGGYDSQPAPHFEAGDVSSWMSPGFRRRPLVHTTISNKRLENIGGETVAVADMSVTAGGTALPCRLEIRVVPDITAISSPHAEGGWSRVSLSQDADGHWVVSLSIDGRVGRAGGPAADVRNILGHGVDEAAIIIGKSHADPTTNIAAEHEGRVFVPGGDPAATPSGHDGAHALELARVFNEVPGWTERFRLANENLLNTGTAIPADVLRIQERINSHLDTMGFLDAPTREARIAALQRYLGTNMPAGLADYIRGRYGQLRAAETRVAALFGADPGVITPELVVHLTNPGPPDNFAGMGLKGGHEQNGLYIFVDSSTTTTPGGNTRQRFQVSIVRERNLAGMVARIHIQWERGANIMRDVPPRDLTSRGTSATSFPQVLTDIPVQPGWNVSTAPKTTVDRIDILLREANQAFSTWAAGTGATTAGNEVVFGTVPGATAPALTSANGVILGGRAARIGGRWVPTRVWLENANFGL